jgi:excisionase family DNA binding protein
VDKRAVPAAARGLLDVDSAAAYLSVSRAKFYQLLAPRGPIAVLKIGRSTRVALRSLDAYIDEQLAAGQGADVG